MNDRIEDSEGNKNQSEHQTDVLMQSSDQEDTRIKSESEVTRFGQESVQERHESENDNNAAQKITVEPGPEISHFLKTEDHSSAYGNDVIDSASVVHGVGHMLRNARMDRNISVEDVSRQLRISVQQVEAIEKE